MVLHVAAGEDTVDVGPGRARLREQVAVVLHRQLTLEQVRVGLVADGHEHPRDRELGPLAGRHVLHGEGPHLAVGAGTPEGLVAVDLRDTVSGAIERLDTEGAFIAIGHSPATELFRGKLELDADGYIVPAAPGSSRTSTPGVFASGDVMDKVYRQAVTAAGMGCMAALDAEKFLAEADFEATPVRSLQEA